MIKCFRDAARVRPARPQQGDDDGAVHARLHRAAGEDLPPPRRARDGRHGGVHPDPQGRRRPTSGPSSKVREDKAREAGDGFDGTWVAHPDFVPVGDGGVRQGAGRPAQPDRPPARRRARDRRASCSTSPSTPRRRSPRRACATTSTSASSTSRHGCAATAPPAIYGLMEDAATAEIARSQVWQWVPPRRARRGAGPSSSARRARRAREDPRRGRRDEWFYERAARTSRAGCSSGGAGRRVRQLPHAARLRGAGGLAPQARGSAGSAMP